MLTIVSVEKDSIADELHIRPGDRVVSVNGREVNDQLDFRFFSAEQQLELLIHRDEQPVVFDIEKDYHEDLGLELQEMEMRACGNNCPFCFVYQNPKGMRRSMYFKDEDYRFSFLYGHYVTLTTVTQEDLDRIVEQQLSPLFISVHSTESETRKILLGIKHDDGLMEKIDYLTRGGIELHTQIVLTPDINDGEIFTKTVDDLLNFYPGVRSVAIVPLGLTKHRKNLKPLRVHRREELVDMIHKTNEMREILRAKSGSPFIYLADEFFIKADHPLPPADYYEEFFQIENGVGEFRDLIDRFDAAFGSFPAKLEQPFHLTWVTGTMAADWLEKFIIDKLRTIEGLRVDLVAVKNSFYGDSIGVSGLLVGQDIHDRLKNRMNGDAVFLPPRVLNNNGVFLDDWTPDRLQKELGVPCHVFREDIEEIMEVISRVAVNE